ncbi:hypothetical protein GGR56DRAFT_671505 [Xylariaceae sp. FL0804]|nr:hypothetical protein GGR56DRAFT_671505 [Xylariaceae sp. FL0804]
MVSPAPAATLIVVIVVALAVPSPAQSILGSVPPCARGCVEDALGESECGAADCECVCSDIDLYRSILDCVEDSSSCQSTPSNDAAGGYCAGIPSCGDAVVDTTTARLDVEEKIYYSITDQTYGTTFQTEFPQCNRDVNLDPDLDLDPDIDLDPDLDLDPLNHQPDDARQVPIVDLEPRFHHHKRRPPRRSNPEYPTTTQPAGPTYTPGPDRGEVGLAVGAVVGLTVGAVVGGLGLATGFEWCSSVAVGGGSAPGPEPDGNDNDNDNDNNNTASAGRGPVELHGVGLRDADAFAVHEMSSERPLAELSAGSTRSSSPARRDAGP